MRIKWSAVVGGVAATIAVLFVIPSVIRHSTGARPDSFPGAFDTVKHCAESITSDSGVRNETYGHAVNGGVHVISSDSLHRLLPNQPVIALTHTDIDSVRHDTTIAIYTEPPVDLLVLQHEFANALSWRHRRALIGSDTGKFLTSAFYKRCVQYCPHCAAGAY